MEGGKKKLLTLIQTENLDTSRHSATLKNVGAFSSVHLISKGGQTSARSPHGLRPTGSLYTSTPSLSLPLLQDRETLGEMESAIILRQRQELQLLMAELKGREQDLNAMTAAHHKQVTAWEQDRQKVLTLEQKFAHLEDELKKRNEVILSKTKRVHAVEAREKEGQRKLSSTQQQLLQLGQKQQHVIQHCHDLEEKNHSLNSTVLSLSAQLGSLQVRQEELSTMLRLKDKDVTEATNHIVDLSGRLRQMDGSLKDSCSREAKLLREIEEQKRLYREVRNENTQLKEELEQQVTEGSAQREVIIRLKQEGQLLRREWALSGEGQSWKDELLGLARSKHERTESELHCLRQVCDSQQNDLQLLKLNLESTRDALTQAEGQRSPGSPYPSSRNRRSSGSMNDFSSPTTACQRCIVNTNLGSKFTALQTLDHCSTTNRLQRLLAESQEMVASLERTTLQPLSPFYSPVSNSCHGSHSCNPDSHAHIKHSSPLQYLKRTPPSPGDSVS